MKSYYCKRLYEEINFDAEDIYVCCGKSLGPKFPTYNTYSKNNNVIYDKYIKDLIKWRNKCTKNAFEGKISQECQNCIELEQRNYSFIEYFKHYIDLKKHNFPIKNIIVKSFRQCELSCVYCLEKRYTKGKKTLEMCPSDFYSFLPILKALINNKMLNTEDVRLEIQGGSISVWDEFEDVLKLAVNSGIKSYFYHSNAIIYMPIIEDIAKKYKSGMSVAIDSGCRETYKKIKGDDKFDIVITNIIKYAKNNVTISIKYIIIRNINDNIEEIKKFCDTVLMIKNNTQNNISLMLDIDFRDSLCQQNYIIPDNYLGFFKYVINFCKSNNIELGMQDFISAKIERIINDIK